MAVKGQSLDLPNSLFRRPIRTDTILSQSLQREELDKKNWRQKIKFVVTKLEYRLSMS